MTGICSWSNDGFIFRRGTSRSSRASELFQLPVKFLPITHAVGLKAPKLSIIFIDPKLPLPAAVWTVVIGIAPVGFYRVGKLMGNKACIKTLITTGRLTLALAYWFCLPLNHRPHQSIKVEGFAFLIFGWVKIFSGYSENFRTPMGPLWDVIPFDFHRTQCTDKAGRVVNLPVNLHLVRVKPVGNEVDYGLL